MKISQILESQPALQILAETGVKLSTSLKIGLIMDDVNKIYKAYQEAHNKYIKENGVDLGNGPEIPSPPLRTPGAIPYDEHKEIRNKYLEYVKEACEVEADLTFKKINKSELVTTDGKEINLAPGVCCMLLWLIEY